MLTDLIGKALDNIDSRIDFFYHTYDNSKINSTITNFNRLKKYLKDLQLAATNKIVPFDGFELGAIITPDVIFPNINFFQHPHNNISSYNLVLKIDNTENNIQESMIFRGLKITKDEYEAQYKFFNEIVKKFDCRIELRNNLIFISSQEYNLKTHPSIIKETYSIIENVYNASEICGTYLIEKNSTTKYRTVRMNNESQISLAKNTIATINLS